MSNKVGVTVAQAAPAAQDEVCERKDVEQRRRESKVCKAFWMCLASTIFASAKPCAVAIAVQTSADYSELPAANLENPAIGGVATYVHGAELRQPSVEGEWGSGKTGAGSEDATAEWRRGDPRALQGTKALARPLGGRNDNTLERRAVKTSPVGKGGWRLRVVASERRRSYGPPAL